MNLYLQQLPHQQSHVKPGQIFAGAVTTASGTVPRGRSWQHIFNDDGLWWAWWVWWAIKPGRNH